MDVVELAACRDTTEQKSLLDEWREEETTGVCMEDKAGGAPSGAEQLLVRRQVYTQEAIDDVYRDLAVTPTACDVIKGKCRMSPKCLGRQALNCLPIVRTVRNYNWRQWVIGDLISGLSVGFIHLPQGLGFGLLASLQPVHGLYTSFFPVLVYMLFGTSPHVSMGTNALIALLTANVVDREADLFRSSLGANQTWTLEQEMNYKVGVAAATCLVAGLILLAMGLLRLGFITNFLAKSFIGGFTFAAAVHISTSQVVKLLHLNLKKHAGMGNLVLTSIDIFGNIGQSNAGDVVVGLVCMAVLLGVKMGVNERFKDRLKFPVPIELIVVIVSTFVSHFARLHDRFRINIVGDVPTGMPAPALPKMDSIPRVAFDSFVTSLLIFALTISLGKLTAKLHEVELDDNQELVAYGLCQLVGAFFHSFPACIAPPRTMILSSLRSKSTLNGLPTAVFILLVLLVAGKLFVSLPIAMLAAMIIVAMKDLLLQVRNLKGLWHVNKSDFFIWLLTALSGVFLDLDLGLAIGVVVSLLTVVVVSQRAKGTVLGKAVSEDILLDLHRQGVQPVSGVRIFRFESALYFASQERFKSQLYSLVMNPSSTAQKQSGTEICVKVEPQADMEKVPSVTFEEASSTGKSLSRDGFDSANGKQLQADDVIQYVILDCSAMTYIDVAGVDMLSLIVAQFGKVGVHVWLADVPAGTLATLHRAGFVKKVGSDIIFYSVMDALRRIPQSVISVRF